MSVPSNSARASAVSYRRIAVAAAWLLGGTACLQAQATTVMWNKRMVGYLGKVVWMASQSRPYSCSASIQAASLLKPWRSIRSAARDFNCARREAPMTSNSPLAISLPAELSHR